jgi:cytochrome P450
MAVSDEWLSEHFDYLSHDFGDDIHPVLERMRQVCPVAHSDQHDGYWILSRYEDVLRAAQDWETWSSEVGGGVGIPATHMTVKAIPVHIDPPLHREYKRLINAWFTPAVVAPYEDRTRQIVTRLIDDFIDDGECEFQSAFAQPFPGAAFFELVLDAPPDEAAEVNAHATEAANPANTDAGAHWAAMHGWIVQFLDKRRSGPRRADVVDAVLHAEIEGRPIREDEVVGIITLLILGGLDTTAGVLGGIMLRFCEHPEIPALLREKPDLVPAAVEELLRLEGSFIGIGRTATHETELGGCPVAAGGKAYLSWASANRDEAEFEHPHDFDLDRVRNRHIAFGAGPHRCAGSNLARLNLRVAVHELTQRLHDVKLTIPTSEVPWHTGFARAPLRVPISFRPSARR